MNLPKAESHSNRLRRLFSPDKKEKLHVGGSHVRDITMQITEDCNLRCTYCFIHEKKPNVMSFDTAKKFIDMILDADERTISYIDSKNSEGVSLAITGGEPLLEMDLLSDITDYFIEQLFVREHPWANRYRISICSNGLLYFNPKFQEYIKRHREHLSFSISIDGDKGLHDACRIDVGGKGSYDRAVAAMKHYTTYWRGQLRSKMTIAPGNVHMINRALQNMIELGYTDIHLNCVFEEGWTVEHAKILYEQLKLISDYLLDHELYTKVRISMLENFIGEPQSERDNQNYCGGTGLMLAVDWKGDIYPCYRYTDSAINNAQEEFIIGNVTDGIMRNEQQCDRVKCLSCITRRSQSTDECFYCPIGKGCSWCSAYNYEVFGTPNKRATYICIMHKANTLACIYHWNKLYRSMNSPKRKSVNIPESWALEIIDKDEFSMLQEIASDSI